jgi:hypothetical protein
MQAVKLQLEYFFIFCLYIYIIPSYSARGVCIALRVTLSIVFLFRSVLARVLQVLYNQHLLPFVSSAMQPYNKYNVYAF